MQDEELEFENNLIQLEDEDGNPTSFEFLDLIPYEGKEYVVLLPADEDADEVEILELAELDDEMEEYRSIEDTAILKQCSKFSKRSSRTNLISRLIFRLFQTKTPSAGMIPGRALLLCRILMRYGTIRTGVSMVTSL